MPRLLIVTTYPLTLKTFLLPYARHFRALGWRVDALTCGDTADIADAFDSTLQVGWSKRLIDPRTLIGGARRVREVAESGAYDIVHVHTPVAAFAARMALRQLRAAGRPKVVYTAHGFHFRADAHPLRNAPFVGLERLAGRWTDYLVVMNREDEEAARQHRIVPPEALRYMPGIGVELTHYGRPAGVEEVGAALQSAGLAPGTPYFLCIAEFRPVKRHCDLLHAFARVARSPGGETVQLLLAGNGPLEGRTRRLAAELGIAERVHFLGFRDDIPVLLRGARALTLASDAEGLPRCVLEAMAARTPVVASAARGTTDLLEGGHGLLAPLRSPELLGDRLLEVLRDPAAAAGRAALAAASVERYSVGNLLAAHEALYDEALAQVNVGAYAGQFAA